MAANNYKVQIAIASTSLGIEMSNSESPKLKKRAVAVQSN